MHSQNTHESRGIADQNCDRKNLSRRNLLMKSGMAAVTGLLGWMGYSERHRIFELIDGPTEACRLADYIARTAQDLPDVGLVRTDRHAEARHCFVFLRQFHWVEDLTEQELQSVRKTQGELARIIEHYMDDPEIRLQEVLDEGETEEFLLLKGKLEKVQALSNRMEQLLLSDPRQLQKEMEVLQKLVELSRNAEEKQLYLQEIASLREEITQTEHLVRERIARDEQDAMERSLSAADMLKYKRNLRVVPAEETMANIRGGIAMRQGNNDRKSRKRTFDDREKVAVERATEQGTTVSFVIYGAAHDFRQEVRTWNAAHPSRRITLVEITPKQVKKEEDEN